MLRPQGLSAHQQRHGAQYSGSQDPVPPHQWSQELECVSVALWALRGVCGLVGARCRPSSTVGAACCPTRPGSLARTARGDHDRPPGATDALSLSSQASGLSLLLRGTLGGCRSPASFALTEKKQSAVFSLRMV